MTMYPAMSGISFGSWARRVEHSEPLTDGEKESLGSILFMVDRVARQMAGDGQKEPEPAPASDDASYYWWCERCQTKIEDCFVTSLECHDGCGGDAVVRGVNDSTTAPTPDPDEAMLMQAAPKWADVWLGAHFDGGIDPAEKLERAERFGNVAASRSLVSIRARKQGE